MKLFSDFRSCYCGTANASSPPLSPPQAAPSPLPDDANDGPRRRHLARSKTLGPSVGRPKLSAAAPSPLPDDANDGPRRRHLERSKTSAPSVWRPRLSAILEDRVIPPPVADEKSVEKEEGESRKRWRRRRSSDFKKSETFNYGDDEQFVSRRKSSFSMAMGSFWATPFMF